MKSTTWRKIHLDTYW